MTSTPSIPAAVIGSPTWLRIRWSAVWRALTDRVVPAVVFGIPNISSGRVVLDDLRIALGHRLTMYQGLVLAGRCLYFLFVTFLILLFVIRPPARARDGRISSWLLALLGTFGLSIALRLPAGPVLFRTGTAGAFAEAVILVAAASLALVSLDTLGRSFSITPQARTLVARGPYRVVRHPLYLCESLAILAISIPSGATTLILAALVVIAIQVRRAQLEERLLRRTFSDYEEVFRGVPHFIPGIY